MQIVSITLNNYGSYRGDHTLKLDNRGLVFIEGNNLDEFKMDSNGSGKSQIPDSLDWCINGEIPRGDHVDSIINDSCESCSVVVNIETDDKKQLSITRTKPRGKSTQLSISLDEKDLTALDIKETQKLIYQILGIDREIFHSTVLFAQTDLVHYADSTDKKRMDILTKLLQLGGIDDLLNKVKAKVKELDNKNEGALGKLEVVQQTLQNLKIKDWEFEVGQWKRHNDSGVLELVAMLDSKVVEFRNIGTLQDSGILQNKIVELKAQVVEGLSQDDSFHNLMYQRQAIGSSLGIVSGKYEVNENTRVNLLTRINRGELICDKCKQVVSIDHLTIELEELKVHKVDFERSINTYRNDLNILDISIEEERSNYALKEAEVVKRNSLIREQIEQNQKILFSLQNQIKQKASLENEMVKLRALIQNKKNEVNPWLEQQRIALEQIDSQEAELINLNSQIASIAQLKAYYSFWNTAFGAKGLKSYILDSKLKELNDSINYWVNILTGGTIWVEFGSYKTNRSNKVVNSPDIKVCRWNTDGTITTRNYKSWSGGEKQRISLAIDFGMSSLIARRAKHNYSIIILDEVFKHLDRGGKEAVMEMLKLLANEKSSVFVIEHDSEFQSMFESKICIEKQNGVSNIKEGSNNEQQKYNEEKFDKVLPVRAVRKRIPIRKPIS